MEVPEWVPPCLRPVIILDWDGVLIFRDGQWSREAMEELNRLCFETGAATVLTTSFLYSGSVKSLHEMMWNTASIKRFRFWAKRET